MREQSMDKSIANHWAQDDLFQKIQTALVDSGIDPTNVTVDDLSAVDHVHARGFQSTVELMDELPIKSGDHVLDIGCGIGGPARYVAHRFNCKTYGIDITESFIDVAHKLSELVRMQDATRFQLGDGHNLPYNDNDFDLAFCQHVTMNVKDRAQFFSEAFRVIKPGACFALTEHGLGQTGTPVHPLPWSRAGENEYLMRPDETESLLKAAGFTSIQMKSTGNQYLDAYKKAINAAKNGKSPKLGVHLVIGADALLVTENAARNIEEGRTFPVQFICRKPG